MGLHISQLPKEVKDRLGLKDPQHKPFWAIIGNKEPIYFRSSWEYYYAMFQAIKRGVRSYLPDFCITHLNGSEEWSEVKGFLDTKSKTKMKRMAKYYPEVNIRLVGSDWFKQNLKACKALEPILAKKVVK